MTKILVTGGAGYVGSVSVEAFLAAGHDVVVLDDLTTGHRAAVPHGARLHVGSYGDGTTVARLLTAEGIEAILHCAARSLVGESIADPARYFRDNVAGGITLLEAAREVGVDRVVFSSTAAVYGVPDSSPVTEDAPLRPINPYGETKRSFEGALEWYGRAYGMRSVTLRYFNVAGATEALGEDHEPETHLIPTILRSVEAKKAAHDLRRRLPDARWHLHPRLHPRRRPGRRAPAGDRRHGTGRLAHLTRGGRVQPRQRRRVQQSGRPGRGRARGRGRDPHEVGQRRPGDPPVLVASADRAAEILGWRPRRPSIDDMVGSAWAWRVSLPAATPTEITPGARLGLDDIEGRDGEDGAARDHGTTAQPSRSRHLRGGWVVEDPVISATVPGHRCDAGVGVDV